MKWPRYSLAEIAPASPTGLELAPGEDVWHLGLEHIESHTGRVTLKLRAPVEKAGNSTFAFDERNVLYSKLRPYLNKVVVPDEPGIATTELIPLRPRQHLVLREYLGHYLRSPGFLAFASQFVTGAKMPRVIIDKFWAHEVPVPPLSEQRRIVEILDQADRLRRLRAEADAKADRILPALLFRLLGSPRDWAADSSSQPLEELVKPVSGGTPSKRNRALWNGEIPWVSPKDMKSDFICDSEDHVSTAALEETNLSLVASGSALIVVRGMILARDVPVALSLRRVTINQDMKALLPRSNDVTGAYVWAALYLAKPLLQTLVRTAGHGTRKLDTPDLMEFSVPRPDSVRLARIASIVEHRRLVIERRRRAAEELDRLFAVLLSKAFEGYLTASWREAHLKELLQEMEQQARALGAAKA